MEKPVLEDLGVAVALPLPIYSSKEIAQIHMPDGATLSVHIGLTEKMAAALKAHALDDTDEELQGNTSDRRRFGEGSYEAWYAKERYPFVLVDEHEALAAIIWFGPEKHPQGEPGNWNTVAFRSYPPYRGKGIMKPFSMFVIQKYLALMPNARIWLETGAHNVPAISLYEKLGFKKLGYSEGNERLFMEYKEPA